jgi:hypothetical protein
MPSMRWNHLKLYHTLYGGLMTQHAKFYICTARQLGSTLHVLHGEELVEEAGAY